MNSYLILNLMYKIKSDYVERIIVRSTPSKCISAGLLAKESKNYSYCAQGEKVYMILARVNLHFKINCTFKVKRPKIFKYKFL